MVRAATIVVLLVGIALGVAGHALVAAQSLPPIPGVSTTPLVRTNLTGVDSKEVILAVTELAPGAAAPRHIHHGQEFVYVLEGVATTNVEGQPTRQIKAGDHLHRPFRVPHDLKNTGTTPVKIVSVFVVDKGKPLIELVN